MDCLEQFYGLVGGMWRWTSGTRFERGRNPPRREGLEFGQESRLSFHVSRRFGTSVGADRGNVP